MRYSEDNRRYARYSAEAWVAGRGSSRDVYDQWAPMPRDAICLIARHITEKYIRMGINPTLRQVYYQMVKSGLMPNEQANYKRLVGALSKSRLDGTFPLEWLDDRTRTVTSTQVKKQAGVESSIQSALSAFRNAPSSYIWAERWHGHAILPAVIVEKDALASIFEPLCARLGVSLLICRGYPSISSLHAWLERMRATRKVNRTTDRIEALCFFDHDPEGLDIPRSIAENLATIKRLKHWGLAISTRRIALTMDQAQQLGTPPAPAKVSSARFKGYIESTGTDDTWELDAIDPVDLMTLIEDSVNEYFDERIYNGEQAALLRPRAEMRARIDEMIEKMES